MNVKFHLGCYVKWFLIWVQLNQNQVAPNLQMQG